MGLNQCSSGCETPRLHRHATWQSASVTLHLDYYGENMILRGAGEVAWVPQLVPLVPQIDDRAARRQAGQHLIQLARKASIPMPPSILDDYTQLFREYLAGLSEDRRQSEIRVSFNVLQHDEQLQQIQREYDRPNPQVLGCVRPALSLPENVKNGWYTKLLEDCRNLPDRRHRASVLSGLGGDLWETEPQQALSVLWESLSLARQLGIKPIPVNLDDGPGYHGWRHPPTNADGCSALSPRRAAASEPSRTKALWSFASRLDDAGDRDAVLEELGRRLVVQKDFKKATGLALLLNSPLRRARLFAAIAVAQSGKALTS